MSAVCNMACTGDSSEVCGGSNAITIFQHAQSATTSATSTSTTTTPALAPTPTIVKNVGTFEYKGCFVDRPDNQPRVIGTQLTIASVSAETCTAACKAAGFPLAGLEFGQECWCAQYMSMVAPAPDSDCNMVCNADSTELCGAGNRLAVYQDTTATPIPTTQCLTTAILFPGAGGVPDFNFNLQMVPSSGGGTPTLLGAVFRNMTRPINQKIYEISGGPSLEVVTHAFVLSGNDDIGDFSAGFGDAIVPGGPLLLDFVDSNSVNVCAQPNPLAPLGPFIGPPVLAVNGNSGVWSTCASDPLTPIFSATSANGQCSGVFLEMVPPAVA
ncbi:hypothetical protein CVT26_013009 [Gymnopilus dilepis]|uniref:WSC domain-containing protein n=1 Tax=Gymnopilus dilepis TaxID=231916 RepID=A0A409WVF1_9AGAR|nr:hypothetical protein CVT26_013009 [Gymnopilus dilepis]